MKTKTIPLLPDILKLLKDIELLMRVNSPMSDGGPMHKSVLRVISRIQEECIHGTYNGR